MLALWLVDNATEHSAASFIHFCSSISCLAFVAEFLRTRVIALQQSRAERRADLTQTTPRSIASKPAPIQQV
jgi:hypothetical protein